MTRKTLEDKLNNLWKGAIVENWEKLDNDQKRLINTYSMLYSVGRVNILEMVIILSDIAKTLDYKTSEVLDLLK